MNLKKGLTGTRTWQLIKKGWRFAVEWLLGPPLALQLAPKPPEGFLGDVLAIVASSEKVINYYEVADGLAVVALICSHKVYWRVNRQWPVYMVSGVLQSDDQPVRFFPEKGIACWEIPYKMAATSADAVEIARKQFSVDDRRSYLDLHQPFQPN
ncbi:MAG: hypothetical protein WCT37_03560 [Patescibacteria group bacterium]|jgi:hypothetical protein